MPPGLKKKVVVRRMAPQAQPRPALVRRKAGERVGLTKDQILEAAKKALSVRPGPVTVKAVAADLGVAHNSISGRLRREGTTLERELARDFLFNISRGMLPGEDWRPYLGDLFEDALRECEAHPGLARAVTPWLGQTPLLCSDFTERVLHLLAMAGLSVEAAEATYDVVIGALCGMLAVRSPDFGGDPDKWAKAIADGVERVHPRRLPLMHRSRKGLAAIARDKARIASSNKADCRSGFAQEMTALVVLRIQAIMSFA